MRSTTGSGYVELPLSVNEPSVPHQQVSGPLAGYFVVEMSSFVAGPFAGMNLAQLGAEVIRIDPIGGGPDVGRWPVSGTGRSLYWAGLNKGKKSVCLELRSQAGRDLLRRLIAKVSERNGVFVTNMVPGGWLSYQWLSEEVDDLIMCQILGDADGTSAVDYTINASMGYPMATGPSELATPVNSLLPTWDLLTGMYLALAIVTAVNSRRSGKGGPGLIEISLADVALSVVGALGNIAEVSTVGTGRAKDANHVYGTFGSDFRTADGRRVMVVALTPKQWRSLCEMTDTCSVFSAIEVAMGTDFSKEGDRYGRREMICAILKPWFSSRSFDSVKEALNLHHVLWGPYQTFEQLVAQDPRCSVANPLFGLVDEPEIGTYLVPKSPVKFSGFKTSEPLRAPRLGSHSSQVVREYLSLDDEEIDALVVQGTIWDRGSD